MIKIGAIKRAAASYQEPNARTLTNLDKKLKPTPELLVSNDSTEVIIDESLSTESKQFGKYDCVMCNRKFLTSGSLCQHKRTDMHKNNM